MLSKAPSLLEQLEQHLNVDCDNLDPAFIQTLPIRPHDQTSNQRIVHEAFVAPENKEIMEKTVKDMKGSSWDDIYVVCVSRSGVLVQIAPRKLHISLTLVLQLARIAATVAPHISGKVLSQTSPSHAYDKDYIVMDARRRYNAYIAAGIPK